MMKINLALDWTPNINHIGFFVAQNQGFFKEYDLDVNLISPSEDNYALTPAKKVELGKADLALCPTESLISYRTKENSFPLLGIAAIFQEDLSAIAVRKDSHINSPKDLDGKVYASYEAKYEDAIVKEMVKNDGGKGDLKISYPEKLGIWDRLIEGNADSTWIFMNWEGVVAEKMKYEFNYFKMSDHDIPYSYSPVISGSREKIDLEPDLYAKFLQASKKGFLWSKENPQEAIAILKNHLAENDADIDLMKCLNYSAPHLGNEDSWGKMDLDSVQTFLDWLRSKGLEKQAFKSSDLIRVDLV